MKLLLACMLLFSVYNGMARQSVPQQKRASKQSASAGRILWDSGSLQKVSSGEPGKRYSAYARLIQLQDRSLLCVYEADGNVVVVKSTDRGQHWSAPIMVAARSNGYNMSVPDLLQLKDGSVLVCYNPRPYERAPDRKFSIRTKKSYDGGVTWTDERLLYEAGHEFKNGCWEPAAIQLPNGEIQLFFANEGVYTDSDEQNISMLRSADDGLTWSATPVITSFRAGFRDGMPSPVLLNNGKDIVFAIEDNGIKNFKPVIIRNTVLKNWTTPVSATSNNRTYALQEKIPDSIYAGAPYLRQLSTGETILSYQGTEGRPNRMANAEMKVVVGNTAATNFSQKTSPFTIPANRSGLWNSLSVIEGDTIIALTSTNAYSSNGATEVWMIKGHLISGTKASTTGINNYNNNKSADAGLQRSIRKDQHKNFFAAANGLPVLPVGFDAYRMWHLLPMQRMGARTYMRSTYDRRGGIDDTGHFLFMNEENNNVTLDVKGKGILYFFRTNHWHGSPWRFSIDGKENIVQETATADPVHAKQVFKQTSFIPEAPFPRPLSWTWGTTKGANLIWTPMSFRDSLRIAYSRTYYGTGYYIYQLYANEENLSRPLSSFDLAQVPEQDVMDLINRSGTDIAPLHITKKTGKMVLNKETVEVMQVTGQQATIRALKLTLPLQRAIELERIRLRITWDGRAAPSVDAPLCLFFGAGTLYNRDNREYLVKGFPINIRFDSAHQQVELSCYYPMPFFTSARIELTGIHPGDTEIGYEVRYEPSYIPATQSSYFHATYNNVPGPALGKDIEFLDTKGIEGRQDWSGSFVGTSFIFSHAASLSTLEGDPRFFFDDSQTPQGYGTGTEEWGGGGDYWGGENMTLPFAGHPCGARNKQSAKNEKDLVQSAYRFLIADLMPFGKRAVIRFEHGDNFSAEHYETVTYWYGLPASTLIKTDSLDIGNSNSEQQHHYRSAKASPVDTVLSRFEWGLDTFPKNPWNLHPQRQKEYTPGVEIYAAEQKDGRHTRGSSEFTIQLHPANRGALLRRTLDYRFPNQTARVYIANPDAKKSSWQYVGTWYLAGSNTCVYSRPARELDKRFHEVQTSNRRLRDDEFMLPARFTKGHTKLAIKMEFVPNDQQLYPGFPFPEQSAWSELNYAVYSYVLPAR